MIFFGLIETRFMFVTLCMNSNYIIAISIIRYDDNWFEIYLQYKLKKTRKITNQQYCSVIAMFNPIGK